jgi:hypothetical protein
MFGSCLVDSLIDCRNLGYPQPSFLVLQIHHFRMRPVEVIGDEGYLLAELLEGVA